MDFVNSMNQQAPNLKFANFALEL